jgi:hypothetical protein
VSDADDIIVVPIAIRPDVAVRVALPVDITPTEAKKVAAVVVAYAAALAPPEEGEARMLLAGLPGLPDVEPA